MLDMERYLVILALLPVLAAPAGATVPDNMTLELSGLSGDFYTEDGGFAGTSTESEYPYIAVERPGTVTGIVGFGEFVQLERFSGTASITQETTGFLVPVTEGDRSRIERRRDAVVSKTFLDQVEPSFSFASAEPMLKISLIRDFRFSGASRETRSGKIRIENTGGRATVSFQ